MNLSELCIRRPVMTILVMASLALGGFFGYRQLPIAAIPRIDVPTITVSAQLPGASPDTMAVSVAAPLERQFATIAGVTNITSSLDRGLDQHHARVRPQPQIDAAALDVQSAISVATGRLPSDLSAPPSFRKVNPADTPVIFLALTSQTAPLAGDQRVRRQGDEPAPVDAAGRRAGEHQRRPEAGRAHPLRPRRAGGPRHRHRGAAQCDHHARRRRPARLDPHRAPDLHPRDQGRRADGRLFPAGGDRVAQRRAGAPAGRRQGRRLRRERGGARRVQRRALDHRLRAAPARRQHRRGHRCRQEADPAVPARPAADDQPRRSSPTGRNRSATRSTTCS